MLLEVWAFFSNSPNALKVNVIQDLPLLTTLPVRSVCFVMAENIGFGPQQLAKEYNLKLPH
jgi:hypothetical protein